MSDEKSSEQIALFSVTTMSKPDPERLKILKSDALLCQKCDIRRTCTQVVFGDGKTDRPVIAFVGEMPGATDDVQGRPFTGPAGDLLTKMLTAMEIPRKDAYFCTIVNCRPPDERAVTKEEIARCREWLHGQLRFTQPRVIVALGMAAANALLETRRPEPLGKHRGVWHEWQGIPLRVTFHPNHLHRHPLDKPYAWQDLQEVLKVLKSQGK